MSSTAPQARYKTPLIPSLFKTIRSGYTPNLFSRDLSAGITVGIVAIPLALAFAIASGLTPERGLYTSIVAGFFHGVFQREPVPGQRAHGRVRRHHLQHRVPARLRGACPDDADGGHPARHLRVPAPGGTGQIYPLSGDHGLHHRDRAADLLLTDKGFLRAAPCRYSTGIFR